MCCCLNEAVDKNLLEGRKNIPQSCFLFTFSLPLSTDTLHSWTWRHFTHRLMPSECSFIFSSVHSFSFCWQTKDGFVELDKAVCTAALRRTHMETGTTKRTQICILKLQRGPEEAIPVLMPRRYAGAPLHKLWHVPNCQHLHQPRAIMCSLETGEREI